MSVQGPGKAGSGKGNGAKTKAETEAEEQARWDKLQREFAATFGATLNRDNRGAALMDRFDAALERLEKATPRPATLAHGLIRAPDGVLDFDHQFSGQLVLPPAITDRLTRGEKSMLVSDPNVGKTTYTFLEALAIADEQPALIGQAKIDWCGPVMMVSNEDISTNGAARWREQRRKLGMSGPLKHLLSIWPSRLTLARFQDNALFPTEGGCAFVETLAGRAERGVNYAAIILDPLTGLFPGVTENDATQMDAAFVFCGRISTASFGAVDLAHHTSKSTRSQETVTAYRGGTGSEAASEEISTLIVLSAAELASLGFPPTTRPRSLIRLKGQRKRSGPFAGTYYFEREILHVLAIDPRKPDELAPEMGTVAVMTAIAPPAKPGVTLDNVQRWLWEANQGNGNKRLTRGQRMAGPRGIAVALVMEKGDCDRRTAESLIDQLVEDKRARIEDVWNSKNNLSRVVIAELLPPEVEIDPAF